VFAPKVLVLLNPTAVIKGSLLPSLAVL
jgi:hypothetical protein